MAEKAKLIYVDHGNGKTFSTLTYEYKGHMYDIGTHPFDGSRKLQHERAQKRIDSIIAEQQKAPKTATFDINEIFGILGWD